MDASACKNRYYDWCSSAFIVRERRGEARGVKRSESFTIFRCVGGEGGEHKQVFENPKPIKPSMTRAGNMESLFIPDIAVATP